VLRTASFVDYSSCQQSMLYHSASCTNRSRSTVYTYRHLPPNTRPKLVNGRYRHVLASRPSAIEALHIPHGRRGSIVNSPPPTHPPSNCPRCCCNPAYRNHILLKHYLDIHVPVLRAPWPHSNTCSNAQCDPPSDTNPSIASDIPYPAPIAALILRSLCTHHTIIAR
jgi:hypothetical protein